MKKTLEKWESYKENRRRKKNKPYRIFKGESYYTRKKYERAISDVIKEELRSIRRLSSF